MSILYPRYSKPEPPNPKGVLKETYKSRPGDTERYKNMTTKGAGAEGARPPLWGRPKAALMFLYTFRISGSGFVFVFVAVGVGLTCGIPSAKFWKETTCLKKAFWGLAPLFVLDFKLYGFVLE